MAGAPLCLGGGLSALLPGHSSRLLRVMGIGAARPQPNAETYQATSLTGTAKLVACAACAGGKEDGYLGVDGCQAK